MDQKSLKQRLIVSLPAHAVLLIFAVLSGTQSLANATVTMTAKAESCAQNMLMVTDPKTGKLVDVDFKALEQSAIHEKAQMIVAELEQKLTNDPFANQSWIYSEFFSDFSRPVFDLINSVTQKFTGNNMSGSTSLKDAEVLIYGADSLNTKIQELDSAIKSRPLFQTKDKRENKIKDLSETIRQCKGAVAACKVELPGLLGDLNQDYRTLKKAKAVASQELILIEQIQLLIKQMLPSEESAKVLTLLTKKANDLQLGMSALDTILQETGILIEAIGKVITDIDSVNVSTLQKAVISAAKEQIDIRNVLDAAELPVNYQQAAVSKNETAAIILKALSTSNKLLGYMVSHVDSVFLRPFNGFNRWKIRKDLAKQYQKDPVQFLQQYLPYMKPIDFQVFDYRKSSAPFEVQEEINGVIARYRALIKDYYVNAFLLSIRKTEMANTSSDSSEFNDRANNLDEAIVARDKIIAEMSLGFDGLLKNYRHRMKHQKNGD